LHDLCKRTNPNPLAGTIVLENNISQDTKSRLVIENKPSLEEINNSVAPSFHLFNSVTPKIMHPQLETCIQKVDEFMASYPTLSQYGE
jgi:hypothetical protein